MNNIDYQIEYQIAHSLKELRDWTSKGYKFLAVLDPNDWLMIKEEEIIKEEEKSVELEKPSLYVSKKDREEKAIEEVEGAETHTIRVKKKK